MTNSVTHIKVTPTRNHASATIQAGKGTTLATVTSGSASSALALDVGANEINVKVTAQDGTTTKTYTIVVTRAATDSLVSNVGQATGSGGYRPSDEYVTAFTTGSNAAGYTLTGIDFHVATKTASLTDAHLGTLTASVWTSGGAALTTGLDDLGTKLADLVVPSTASSVTTGPVTFAAPTGTTLAASTTYYVVIGSSAWTGGVNLLLSGTESDNEDAGKAAGFSIANTANTHTGNQFVPWTELGNSEVLSFSVKGAAKTATPGITLSSTAVGVIDGSTEVYEVKLNTQPTASVTITPSSGTTGVATVSSALTFTTTNWNDAQEVTITGVTAGTSTITHAASSTDTNYGSSLSLPSVTATVLAPSTLVSNTGQTPAGPQKGGFAFTHAQAFRTGAHSDGYALTSIGVVLIQIVENIVITSLTGELWSDNNGSPNAKLADLTRPSSLGVNSRSIEVFTAPAGTHLAANTTYHFVLYDPTLTQSGRLNIDWTTSTSEDTGYETDWGIANTARWQNSASPSGSTWTSSNNVRQIQVNGGERQPMYSTAQPPTTLALTTNAASNTIAEDGGNVTVTATLNRAATTAVSVTLTATGTATGTADYSLPSAFTIPIGSTSATGTVTIVDDDIDEDNETVILATTVSGLTVTPVTLTITDDDTAGVTVSQTTRSVQAASTTTYTVVLNSKPTANVVVGATSGTTANATVAPASRTFTATNWNTAQTFTVTGVAAGSSTITHAVTSTDTKYPSSLSIGSVMVTVTPAAPTALSADAGDGSLALSWTAPAGTLTGYDVHYTYAPSTGTGMVANDAAASGSNPATAWVAAARGTETSPPTASQTLSSLDNGRTYRWRVRAESSSGDGAWAFGTGTPVVTISLAAGRTVSEGGLVGERLQTQTETAISGSVTVAAGDTNPASLSADLETGYPTTFTAAAGATYTFMPQINIEDDSVNEEHETFKITLNAGTGYTVGTAATTLVTIWDNDPPAAPSGLSLTAGAQKLTASWSKPVGPVTGYELRYKVTTASNQTATTAGDPSTGWVTITPSGTNGTAEITGLTNGTSYHVQVRATDGQPESGNGWGDWSSSQTGTPTATPAAGVIVSKTFASVVTGSTTTYTIKLNKAPTASVVVTPTSGTTGVATVTNQAKTFTTTNWNQTQTVTVTGVAAGSSTITHAATSTDTAYSGITIASVTASVMAASQTAPTTLALTTTAGDNIVAEDGGTVTVTATLNRPATTAVSVTLTATGTATGTTDYSLPSAFTIAAGQSFATGTVTIVDDDIDEANETVILTTSVSGLTVTPVTLTITDNDTAGVTVSQTARSVQVPMTTTYTVVLNSKPTANVTITPTSGTPANATVAPASRTFTPQNWNTAQTFTVRGVAAGSSTITHAATSTDTKYPSSLSIGSVAVTVTPQPPSTLALTTNAASNTIAESGGSVTVTATLNRPATTAVSVTLTATGTATATADYSLPAAFTIAVGQSSATGTVTIVNDDVDEDNETVILTTTVSGLTVTGVTLTISDDDTAGVTVSETTRDVEDGATTTYTVVLDSQPTASVVVAATSGTPAYATVAPASRTFTATNWNVAQTFTVTGVSGGSSTITHAATSTDPKYPSSLSIASVAVRVNPHDTTLSALSFSFSADGGTTFPGSGKLSPEFDPATRTYTFEISPNATHVKFTPTANHPEATMTVNTVATASGASSAAIPVRAGRVTVAVTALSGTIENYLFVLSAGGGGAAGQLGNTVWTSVLIMRDLYDDGSFLGCENHTDVAEGDRCNDTSTLSQDTFYFAGAPGWSSTDTESRGDNDWRASRQYGGVRIFAMWSRSLGDNVPRTLVLTFTQAIPESLRNSLTLVFDGRSFPLRDGVLNDDGDTVQWFDSGIALNEHAVDQLVDVGLYLNPVGPSVTEWQPTMIARSINNSHAKAGCGGDIDCGDPSVIGGNRFSVNAPKYGGLRSYYIKELTVEFVARHGHDEVSRRVTLTVEEHGGTVDLNGTTLELTDNGQSIRLPIRHENRVGNTNTWTWVETGGALAWGAFSKVGVRIIPVTTGLQKVRVHYDEMKNGQPVDGFVRWDIAQAKPHATLGQALVAVIPGEFVSINTREKAITTHAKLLLRGDWPGSTIEYGKGTYDQPPNTFTAVGANGLTGAIPLNAHKANTYVWVRVTNGDQSKTHLVIIDPPPRTFSVNPDLRVTEGETGQVTVSLGSPATSGGVTFNVTTDYGDGVTADDVGEIVSTVTVPEGQRSATISVPTVQDEEIEADERLTVTLTHVGEPLWAVEPGKTGTTAVTIVNDDVGLEPWNIQVVPGDGTLTVTWNISSREGYEDSEIWHALRWSQEFGVWANHRDPRAVGKNDGVSVDPGVKTYTITGLKNDVATGVFIRSTVGHRNNMSERSGDSSKWVRTKGVHTTPVGAPNEAPTVASSIADATIVNESGTHEVSLSGVFDDADGDDLTITAVSSDDSVATVSVASDYSTLTVTAKTRGTATITATADDGNGGTVDDTFTVTVKAAPVVASAIADVSSLAIEATHEVSLSSVFTDADGDALTVTANSSSDAVATASVSADYSTLTVTGKSEGTATITVTAQDSDGNSVSDAFDVTVPAPANQAPTVANAISDATIVNTSGTREVSLSGVFDDADGDDLTITAASSDDSVATVSVASDYSTLTVSAQSRGTATITATADDGNGGTVDDTFTVTVKAAPVVASAIADVSELEIDAPHEVSLSGVFTDADGDGLTVTANSSSDAVATASVSADYSTLTVTGKSEGTATITVTAQDSDGNSVSHTFDVTVPAAQFELQQQTVELPGPVVSIEVTARTEDSVTVTWSAPETGGAPNGYIVHLKPEDGEHGSGKTKRPKATKTKVTYNKLEPGRTYLIWVRGQNETGKGERVHATITLP